MRYRYQLRRRAFVAFLAAATAPAHAQSGETFTWTGGGCGPGNILWLNNDCASCCECENWDPAACLMGFFDTAIIPGGFVVHMVNAVEIGTIEAADSTVIITNNLTVGSEATMAASIDSSSGPVVKALGPITFKGTSIFSRGTLRGPDSFTVPAGSEFNLSNIGFGLPRTLDATLFKNHGTVNANLGLQFQNNATVDNLGTWNANNTLGSSNPDNASGTFNNSAFVIKDSFGVTSFLVPLNNAGGTIRVMNGTLNISRGGNHSGGSYQPNGGSISLRGFDNNGTPDGVRITGPMTATGSGNLQLLFDRTAIESGGSLTANLDHSSTFGLWIGDETNTRVQCDGPIKNSGLMTWRGGTIGGSAGVENLTGGNLGIFGSNGKTLSAPLLNTSGGKVQQSANLTIEGGEAINEGKWTVSSGNINSPDNSVFANKVGGLLDRVQPGTTTMNARYESTVGQARATMGTIDFKGGGFVNSGNFTADEKGTIRFSQGVYDFTSASATGKGEIHLNGATWNLTGLVGSWISVPSGGSFHFQSGQIVGTGFMKHEAGLMTWSGGTIAAGALGANGLFENNSTLQITGPGPAGKVLAGKLRNSGSTTATSFTINGGEFINTGVFPFAVNELILTGGTIAAGASPGIISNFGLIKKIGPGTTNVWPPVNNVGSISVLQGWLELKVAPINLVDGVLSGGSWIVSPNAALKMPGVTISGTDFATIIKLNGTGSEWQALTDHLTQNIGVVEVIGVGTINFNPPGGTLENGGTLESAEGGTLKVNGSVINNETGVMQQTSATEDGGTAGGGGDPGGFIADIVNNHGTIRPGGEGAPGPFNLTGDLVCHETSVIQIELAGLAPIDEHDQLNVTGDIVLAGTLDLTLLNDFAPAKGTEFTIITATGGTISGEFDNITPPNFTVTYTRSSVTLTALAPQVPGDLNGDGVVGVADLLILLSAWGPCADPANCPADFSPPGGDGAVGVADLLFLLANWG